MISQGLKELLKGLDLVDNQAVFFFKEEDGETFLFQSKEIEKKLSIIKPTAFYVFNNQPYILFFDLVEDFSGLREKEIHKQVWSFDQSPLVFIIKENGIDVFNALVYDKKLNTLQKLNITDKERNQQFSFWNLQSGNSWRWLQDKYYSKSGTEKRVNQKLFENLQLVRERLTNKKNVDNLTDDEANTLILRLIFIRYLIDRDVKLDKNFIDGKDILARRSNFIKLIESPQRLNDFFGLLNTKFNGVLFKNIEFQISATQAKDLAEVFKGEKPEEGSLFFGGEFYFEVFDFSIIPVEVISGIYESLIDPKTRELNSAVYTPAFLVDYILNDTVDKYLRNNAVSECKVLDPSCGSGIFLVQSLRRMIDKEIELNKLKIKSKNFSERIREIAKNNLFGIDINPEALKVTCFSIYIALLDYQEPKDIDVYEFPNLINENFFSENFFDSSHFFNKIIVKAGINFIVGNPPWKNGGSDALHKNYLKENSLTNVVGDFQLAQSFTLRTKDFSSENTKCAFVVTSKAIYNINAEKFRKHFLENFFLTKCFDLSPVRRLIFQGADNPAMVLQFNYANDKKTLDNIVLHQSLKNNIYIKYNTLVIEKNDTKSIKQQLFHDHFWMFKVALYGGILDYRLLKKLSAFPYSIKTYVNDIKEITIGDGIKKYTEKSLSKRNAKPVPFTEIKNIPIIETTEINPFYVNVRNENLPKTEDLLVKSGNKIKQYLGDKLLFSPNLKKETEIVIPYSEGNSVYREKTLGLTTLKRSDVLKEIFITCSSDLYTYYQYLITSHWGIYYSQILQKEYLSFPYYDFDLKAKQRMGILADNIFSAFKDYYSKELREEDFSLPKEASKQINKEINALYGIKGYEKDLIDYVLNISRYQFQSEKKQREDTSFTTLNKTHYRNDELVLKQYAEVFLKEFEKIYEHDYLQVLIYSLNHFIAINFVFTKEKPEEKIYFVPKNEISNERETLRIIANSISISQVAKDLFIQKDIKGFEDNSFYIIKPREYKCWHRAMAWYDVAEIKEIIEQAEYSNFEKGTNAE